MSIDKYKKSTPDFILSNSSSMSNDGTDIRMYKINNVVMADNNLEWAFSTNFNNITINDNTYFSNNNKGNEWFKTGVTNDEYKKTPNNRDLVKLNKDNITFDKITGGVTYALLYDPLRTLDYNNLYIPSNFDYERFVIGAAHWNSYTGARGYLDDSDDTLVTDGYVILPYFNTGTDFVQMDRDNWLICMCFKVNDTVYIKPLSSSYTPEMQLYSRWYKYTLPETFNAEKPFMSNTSYNYMHCVSDSTASYPVITLPVIDYPMIHETVVYTSQYGSTYAGFIFSSNTVKDYIEFLNSTGFRYFDRFKFTEYADKLANTYIGVMDENGITDCGNRIKGWNEIDDSELPNAHKNGYEWDVYNPENPPIDVDKDDTEKMNIGGFYAAGGLVNYYSLVNTPEHNYLNELSTNLSNWDYVETGKDVLRNLISLKAIPISRELLCRGTTKEIVIAGTDTGVSGQTIDSTYDAINMGTITIPHRYNDFRDYAPYTKIEICAPFVGWITLPSHCMGHSVTVRMTYDIVTCNCKVFCILDDNTIVAESCGVIAMDIPFTAEAAGMKAANMMSSLTGIASSALSLGGGIVSGNTMGTASGIIGLANSVTQTICANNANYTETRGNAGDSNNFSGVKQCFLKVTYPVSHIPDDYGHVIGYLYNKTSVLTGGMGYTKTSNTYISGNMTETEKNEIVSLMETGVIL